MAAFDAYIICTSPRSGSTLLCHMLRETKGAGHPGSHFHTPSLEGWLKAYGLDRTVFDTERKAISAVFEHAIARGKGRSDIFGLRLQQPSFDFFSDKLASLRPSLPTDRARVADMFGRCLFIHLARGNKVDQAVSYVKAQQSGLWHMAPDGTEIERLSEPQELVYDPKAIARQLGLFQHMDQAWSQWFEQQKIEPLRLTYEALSLDPYATLSAICYRLDVVPKIPKTATPPVAKLADETSRDWAERFTAETRGKRL